MAALDRSALADRYRAVASTLPAHVTLVAVSKTRSVQEIMALYELGHRDFGENYPQELKEKAIQLPTDIVWHFIGHLQRSNVKNVLPYVHLIHGIDSEKLLDEVAKRAYALDRVVDVLLQVHIAQEDTKHGFSADGAADVMRAAWPWAGVRPRGLMGMASNTDDDLQVSTEFEQLAALFDSLKRNAPAHFDTLSMGMSGDAPLAIKAGSTLVRIGTAIFGERSPKVD